FPAVAVAGGRKGVVVPKQLVGTVDEVNVQAETLRSKYPARRKMSNRVSTKYPVDPPIEPMLAKLAEALPADGSCLYEPKWDGFRAIVFRGGDDVFIQSRDLRPLDRYFPELHNTFLNQLPGGCIVDGEIVIATSRGLDFDALQMRLHP